MQTPKIETALVSALKRNARNARTHSKKQILQIADSIRAFGWTQPILADDKDNVIAGHGRLAAALELKLKTVPVIYCTELTEVQKRALAIADNKIAANAGWDRAVLATELGELATLFPELNLDLEITGFEPAEIDSLMGDFSDAEVDPSDFVPSLESIATSRTSDLWKLGEHRLLCGDCRRTDHVKHLMGKNRAFMVITDPPYNVRVSSVQGRGKIKHREFAVASGEMSSEEFTEFLATAMGIAVDFSEDGSMHFFFMDWRHTPEILAAGKNIYDELKNMVVWVKSNPGQGSRYRSQHELVFVFKSGEERHQNNIQLGKHGRSRSNVWQYAGVNTFRKDRLAELTAHPTVKPVALVADAMRDCSRRGDIVLDLFMGSGTTILAAEKVGRRGFGIEIDPLYVDVAIRRWQEFTKLDAVLVATGQTFDEVAAERSASPALKRVRI